MKPMAIQALEKIIQEPKWIPVSERLPNLDDYTGSKVWQKKVLITGYLSFDNTKDLFVSEAFANDVICNNVHNTVVVAWMPLPEPYKAESSEENEFDNLDSMLEDLWNATESEDKELNKKLTRIALNSHYGINPIR